MQSILLHTWDYDEKSLFDPKTRDSYHQPYIYLRDRLRELGYELVLSENRPVYDCARVLFWDAASVYPYRGLRGTARRIKRSLSSKPPFRDLYQECVAAGMVGRTALMLWEAPAVTPENWNEELHRLFPLIFTWNDKFVDGTKFRKMFWPQVQTFPNLPTIGFDEKKMLVNITMNKSSRHPRELYSARRKTIRYFESRWPAQFDLYGVGWDRPATLMERIAPFFKEPYPSYRGPVANKWDVFPRYRFSVCYENIRDEPGWITEKIFDSMRAGCVPIYWGAPNITDYVDQEAFIDRRKFSSDEELERYLLSIDSARYAQFQQAMTGYLHSRRFLYFLPEHFAQTIIGALGISKD